MSGSTYLDQTTLIDLSDTQGGVLRSYGSSFPKGRMLYFHISDGDKGRAFLEKLRPWVTSAARWEKPDGSSLPDPIVPAPRIRQMALADVEPHYPGEAIQMKPKVTLNIGFTFPGLQALDVPGKTLDGMPSEFADGMAARADVLGDVPWLGSRDPIWRNSQGNQRVHMMVILYAQMQDDGTTVPELDQRTAAIEALVAKSEGGVTLLPGNDKTNSKWQDMASILMQQDGKWQVTNKEHFGLSDGYGDPVFSGQYPADAEAIRVQGGGKIMPNQTWEPLATGEFLLGYADEAQEIPGAAMPQQFSRNGTFMANRKLHENVSAFHDYIGDQARRYARIKGVPQDEAVDTVTAKIVGRWSDGVPLMAAPDYASWMAFRKKLAEAKASGNKEELAKIALEYTNFRYASDPAGVTCPVTSHLRRANPRDHLGPAFEKNGDSASGSALVNRHRILRRGLPYGQYDPSAPSDDGEHGIMFMAVCTNLFRQFEFIQSQWIQYGFDFDAGSDTCPLVGNHPGLGDGKHVIPVDPNTPDVPYICDALPQFVEPRGGDYFFIPSLTSLRLIGLGIVDPT